MANYNQILHIADIQDTLVIRSRGENRGERDTDKGGLYVRLDPSEVDIRRSTALTRISTAGSELMYFAATSKYLLQNFKDVQTKMKQFGFTTSQFDYQTVGMAVDILEKNILPKLLTRYKEVNHPKNKIILENKLSYWTYQVYPDAYFAEKIFEMIK
jgi:hypothetical protein